MSKWVIDWYVSTLIEVEDGDNTWDYIDANKDMLIREAAKKLNDGCFDFTVSEWD